MRISLPDGPEHKKLKISRHPYALDTEGMNRATEWFWVCVVSYCDHLSRAVGDIVELDSDHTQLCSEKEHNVGYSR